MHPAGLVGARSLGTLAVVLVVSSAIFFVPAPLAAVAGRDAWLVPLVAAVPGAAAAWAVAAAYLRPGLDPVGRLRHLPLLRVAAGLVLAAYAAYLGALVVAETAHVLATSMPETPLGVFAGMLGLAGTGLAVYGRAALARTSLIVFPVMVATAAINLVLAIPLNAEFGILLPVLEFGPGPVLASLPLVLAWMGEVLLLGFWAGSVRDRDRARAPAYLAAAVGAVAVLLAAVVAVSVAAMGPDEVARSSIPTVALVRLVRVVPLLSRLETAALTAWLLGVYVKLGIVYYAGAAALRRSLGLREGLHAALVAGVAAASVGVATAAFPRLVTLLEHLQTVWPVAGTAALGFVLILALVPAPRGGARP